MFYRAKTRMLYAWIACVAILFGTLAPLISHAVERPAGASHQVEVCTAYGMKTISLVPDEQGDPTPDSQKHAFEHCLYCSAHAGSVSLPPPSAAALPVVAGHDLFPPLFYQAHSPLFAWTVANPRAPPAAI